MQPSSRSMRVPHPPGRPTPLFWLTGGVLSGQAAAAAGAAPTWRWAIGIVALVALAVWASPHADGNGIRAAPGTRRMARVVCDDRRRAARGARRALAARPPAAPDVARRPRRTAHRRAGAAAGPYRRTAGASLDEDAAGGGDHRGAARRRVATGKR